MIYRNFTGKISFLKVLFLDFRLYGNVQLTNYTDSSKIKSNVVIWDQKIPEERYSYVPVWNSMYIQ